MCYSNLYSTFLCDRQKISACRVHVAMNNISRMSLKDFFYLMCIGQWMLSSRPEHDRLGHQMSQFRHRSRPYHIREQELKIQIYHLLPADADIANHSFCTSSFSIHFIANMTRILFIRLQHPILYFKLFLAQSFVFPITLAGFSYYDAIIRNFSFDNASSTNNTVSPISVPGSKVALAPTKESFPTFMGLIK